MTNRQDMEAAIEYGVDAVGFILYPKSPRYVAPPVLAELTANVPPTVDRVAVGVNLSLGEIRGHDDSAFIDVWQLHGTESPDLCKKLSPLRLVKTFGLPLAQKPDLSAYPVEAFLLDRASPHYGGTGEPFDWALAVDFQQRSPKPIILSGGLTFENVAQAVKMVQPYGVDVCSGVESAPGKKDHVKMKDFIQLCRQL